jgi:serine phosphatase RsbU (regulator of sigma subunit)/ligand-binding sensor domain-containing protein
MVIPMKIRFWFIFFFILLLTFTEQSYAGQWKTYTVADGLIGPDVTAILQDGLGNLWFGTRTGGVSQFDGESFHSYTKHNGLVKGTIKQILEDKRGHLWFIITRKPDSQPMPGTQDESVICRYDGKTFYQMNDRDGLIGGVSDAVLKDKNGDIWVANKYGLMKYDGKRFHRFGGNKLQRFITDQEGANARIYAIFESRDGDIWISGGPSMGFRDPRRPESRGLPFAVLYHGSDFRFFSQNDLAISLPSMEPRPGPPQSANIRAIAEDNDGNIWLGGQNVLIKYDGKRFEHFGGIGQSGPDDSQGSLAPGEVIITWKEPLEKTGESLFPVITSVGPRFFRRTENEWVTKLSQEQSRKSETVNFQYRHVKAEISIETILKDNKGRLWFNNRGFISLWDGKELRHFITPSNWEEIKEQIKLNINKGELPSFYPGNVVFEGARGNIWFKSIDGAYEFDGKGFQPFTVDDGLGSDNVSVIFEAMDGKLWFGHNNGVTLFDPAPPVIQNFTLREALGSNSIHYAHEDKQGKVWFSVRGGIAKYDGEKMQYFSVREMSDLDFNLPPSPFSMDANPVMSIVDGKNGNIWFIGYDTNQIFLYKDKNFQRYSVWSDRGRPINRNFGDREDDRILAIDSEGRLLFAEGESLIRCGEKGCQLLTEKGFQPVPSETRPNPAFDFRRRITEIYVDSQRNVWFAISGVGVKRYNGVNIKTFTASDGLESNNIMKIFEDVQKNIWFVGEKALIKYDGKSFQKFPVENVTGTPIVINQSDYGSILFIYPRAVAKYDKENLEISYQNEELNAYLNESIVRVSITDSAGNIWLATSDGAIKYDGKKFTTYTTEQGLLVNDILDVLEDDRGNIWFATWGGGVALYNGENFQAITTKDGLIHNNVRKILQDNNGNIWFATDGGITKYTLRLNILPRAKLTKIIANEIYTDFGKELEFSANIRHLIFEYQGFSFQQGNMVYTHKLEGLDANWSQPSTDKSIGYKGLKPGSYTFLVKALYKNFLYSNPPAVVRFTIKPHFWTQPRIYLPIMLGIIVLVAFIFLTVRLIVQRRHSTALHAELRQKEETETQRVRNELNEARMMQMNLLPKSAPLIHQFELAGISLPANEVGGDFYDFLTLKNGMIGIALVDVSGKGLRGAMSAVMAYGMLHQVTQHESKVDMILSRLNIDLHPILQESMFTALNLAILNPQTKQIHYSNAGQTYPIMKRNGKAEGVELAGFPLGILLDATFDEKIIDLYVGDYFIFYTDGLTDALNESDEVYGFDRLASAISNASASLNAEEMIQHILQDVNAFVGETKQFDDMTFIVLRCIDA